MSALWSKTKDNSQIFASNSRMFKKKPNVSQVTRFMVELA